MRTPSWFAIAPIVLLGVGACSSTSTNRATDTGGTGGTGGDAGGAAGSGASGGTGGAAASDAGSVVPVLKELFILDGAPGATDLAIDPTTGHVHVLASGGSNFISKLETGVGETNRRTFPSNSAFLQGLAIDGKGQLYVSGFFIGDITLGTKHVDPQGGWGGVVARISPPSSIVSTDILGVGDQSFQGNALLGGSVSVGCVRNATSFHGQQIVADAEGDAIVSLDHPGTTHALFAGPGFQTLYDVATDSAKRIYAAGESPAITGKIDVLGAGAAKQLAVVVSYSSTLQLAWAKGLGSAEGAVLFDVATNPEGTQVVAVGDVNGLVDLGSGGVLPSKGDEDVLVVSFDSKGALVWARTFGGAAQDRAYTVAVHESGDVFVGGVTKSLSIDFDAETLTKQGEADGFLLRLDSSGNVRWASLFGGSGTDGISALQVGGKRLVAAGTFDKPAQFLGQTVQTSPDAGVTGGIAVMELGL